MVQIQPPQQKYLDLNGKGSGNRSFPYRKAERFPERKRSSENRGFPRRSYSEAPTPATILFFSDFSYNIIGSFNSKEGALIVLVDQDGPLADFEGGFSEKWRKKFPKRIFVSHDQRKSFEIYENYPKPLWKAIKRIYYAKGFILNLQPIEGSIEALKTMLALGHDVRICTSPLSNKYSIGEKWLWVEKHLGAKFAKRLIITKDKTLVKGALLIDDKPVISGICQPEWEHIIFDAPYNKEIPDKRRVNWQNWREVLKI